MASLGCSFAALRSVLDGQDVVDGVRGQTVAVQSSPLEHTTHWKGASL